MRIDYNNQRLKEALAEAKQIYSTASHGESLNDEQAERLKRFQDLPVMEKDMLFLFSTKGGAETARLYGCSRWYIYKLVKGIQNKIDGK